MSTALLTPSSQFVSETPVSKAYAFKTFTEASVKVLKAYALETGVSETNWDEGVNKAVDKYYGSKFDKVKTDECHAFLEGLIPNGKERVNKVVQTLY